MPSVRARATTGSIIRLRVSIKSRSACSECACELMRSGSVRRMIQLHHDPHVLLRCLPNHADVAARMILFLTHLINSDFVAERDFYFG